MIEHKWKKKMEALHVVSPAVLKDLKSVIEGGLTLTLSLIGRT